MVEALLNALADRRPDRDWYGEAGVRPEGDGPATAESEAASGSASASESPPQANAAEQAAQAPSDAPSMRDRASIADMVDRVSEVERFRRLLNREVPEQVWLIEGETGIGKSYLLFELRRIALEERNIPCALVNLGVRGGSYLDLLNAIIMEFGQPFKESEEVAGRLRSETSAASSLGSAAADDRFGLASQQLDALTDLEQQRRLTEAFRVDLTTLSVESQVLLLLDSYEQASASTRAWIAGELLSWLPGLPNVIIVIAGREAPEPGPPWRERAFTQVLSPLALADYRAYVEKMGVRDVSEEELAKLHEAFAGNPGRLAEFVQARIRSIEFS